MDSQNSPNDVFVDLDAEGQSDMLCNSLAAPGAIATLHFHNGVDEFFRVLWDLAVGPVWVKTGGGTFASSASCENASASMALTRWRIAGPSPDASAKCTDQRGYDPKPEGWEHASDPDSESGLDVASRRIQQQRNGGLRVGQVG